MKILITGGLGVVGNGLGSELRRRGHTVTGCDLMHGADESGYRINDQPIKGDYVRCDVSEYRELERLLETYGPFDVVYHAAAEFGRWNGEDFYEQLWKTNVIGTKHILRLQEKHGFRLIHFSSSEIYGDYTGTMTEGVPDHCSVHQLNDYAMTKWVNEMQIGNSAAKAMSVIVRLFNTYGPGEWYTPYRSVNCRFIYCALKGFPFKVHRGYRRTSTFLEDTIRTLANIVDNFHGGEVYNIAGCHEHSIEELADLVLKVTGADPRLAVFMGDEPLTTRNKKVDASKAQRDLGHLDTVSLHRGLERTAEWMRNAYVL